MIDRADKVIQWGLGVIALLVASVWGERKAATSKIERRVDTLEAEAARKDDFADELKEIKALVKEATADTKESFRGVHKRIDETNRTILGLATSGIGAPKPRDHI